MPVAETCDVAVIRAGSVAGTGLARTGRRVVVVDLAAFAPTWSDLAGALDELMLRRVRLAAFEPPAPCRRRHRHGRRHLRRRPRARSLLGSASGWSSGEGRRPPDKGRRMIHPKKARQTRGVPS
jgi:hypothetical protein